MKLNLIEPRYCIHCEGKIIKDKENMRSLFAHDLVYNNLQFPLATFLKWSIRGKQSVWHILCNWHGIVPICKNVQLQQSLLSMHSFERYLKQFLDNLWQLEDSFTVLRQLWNILSHIVAIFRRFLTYFETILREFKH